MTGNLEQVLGGSFDPSTVPESEFTPLPAGDYIVQIIGAVIDDTKSGGKMLKFEYQVMTGPHADRKIFDRLNIVNDNETAVKIAYQSLAKITNAVGLVVAKDTMEYVGKRMVVSLDIEPGKGTYVDKTGQERAKSDQNKIKAYSALNGGVTTTQTNQPSQEKPAAKMPWAK